MGDGLAMNFNKITPIVFLASTLCFSVNVHANCSESQKPPPGKPDNFNINEHLSKFVGAGRATSKLPLGGMATKVAIMVSNFAPNRKYDLKNNADYNSSQEFGNWFYGAAAAQMGFSEQEALTAGAVVQQWQNYNQANHPLAGDLAAMADGILHALATGEGDNEDDTAPIKGGHSYSEGPYEENVNSQKSGNSCDEQDDSADASAGSYSGFGGGWGSFSGGIQVIGGGGCYGNCGGPATSTSITDLPNLPSTDDE